MQRIAIVAATCIAAAAFPALGQQPSAGAGTIAATAPGKAAVADVVRITARVEAIDPATRTLTLTGPRGNVVILPAGPEVKNFDQIRVGDQVVVSYVEALSLELQKGGSGIRERVESQTGATAQPGEPPAAAAAREVSVVADVFAVDPKKQIVTLRGPQRMVNLKVRDPNQFKLVKVGDQVVARFTEAVAIAVEPAPKPTAKKK
jgi:hypothetical protein